MKNIYLLASVVLSTVFYFSSLSAARAEVYKWTDEQGITHYASAAPSKEAKPAKLPPIMRGDVKINQAKLATCEKHGGVNCKLGADDDGSVICYDGFKEAAARYRFTCSAPKLEISDISNPDATGTFVVYVRNSKSVEAKAPYVLFKPTGGKEVKLSGPEKIEALGMGEFRYQAPADAPPTGKPRLEELDVRCANCP